MEPNKLGRCLRCILEDKLCEYEAVELPNGCYECQKVYGNTVWERGMCREERDLTFRSELYFQNIIQIDRDTWALPSRNRTDAFVLRADYSSHSKDQIEQYCVRDVSEFAESSEQTRESSFLRQFEDIGERWYWSGESVLSAAQYHATS
ncbi:hypothetical protein K458DRAFT_4263 [Lentithecium fluviatile CBS 122367]|uniref:Uncharacterized protein n=1 Tax=Lentithecium fluviatile CBS 122367 TaxID=1168545 RepID=A0A6G1JMP5_9PLEO|nr:hypothetical protein K458DRAFT_4263 [Lentithecium fluviatile CBS 122367]